jgi:hypothetical protein
MLTTPIDAMREEPLKALGTTIGVLLIVVLLYAIGSVAQGQVTRAAARDSLLGTQQAEQTRCLRSESRDSACDGLQAKNANASVPVRAGTAMYVSYR